MLGVLSAWYNPVLCQSVPTVIRQSENQLSAVRMMAPIRSVTMHPTNNLAAVGLANRLEVRLLDTESGALVWNLQVEHPDGYFGPNRTLTQCNGV